MERINKIRNACIDKIDKLDTELERANRLLRRHFEISDRAEVLREYVVTFGTCGILDENELALLS